MKEKFPLTGIVVSLNTPFDQSGHVDFASMARLIEMHVREGASGFLASAQAGEINELSLSRNASRSPGSFSRPLVIGPW